MVSHQNHAAGGSSAVCNSTTEGAMFVPSFKDRMLAVQS